MLVAQSMNALISRAAGAAVRSLLGRAPTRRPVAGTGSSQFEALERRALFSAYWVTLQYPTTIDSNGGWMQIKDQYDQDQDGVSDYPVTASTPLEAVREAIEGAYCGTVNHCGTQSSLSYSFPARASTDGSDAYQINLSTFQTTGVGSGGIGLQKSWDDPYWDRNIYLPNWNDASWSVNADPRPKVWVQDGTDLRASENDRDPATFTIQREGGDTGQNLLVYFSLGGSAAPSTLPESSYPGYANDGKVYTVTGASPDPNHPGYWVATIPAGHDTVDVTVKPPNDSLVEGVESIVMTLAADLAGQLGGAPGYKLGNDAPVATQPGDPLARSATLTADLHDLVLRAPPLREQDVATIDLAVIKLNSADPFVQNAGALQLRDYVSEHPSPAVRDYLHQK
jgi:hypothetical protein